MHRSVVVLVLSVLVGPASGQYEHFHPSRHEAQRAYERALRDVVSTDELRSWHDKLASQPHPAGSRGEELIMREILEQFRAWGLDSNVDWIRTYISEPVSASLKIVAPEEIALAVHEPPVEGDPYTQAHGPALGFNAYSGSGTATGELVYANYGRKQDFERLRSLGVDCAGKIVIARYGGNYRGFKWKYAEEAGAIGLIIYTDPKDSGHLRGEVYPAGGYANEHHIQRGSILTLDYPGDPLTPGRNADGMAPVPRISPDTVALPTIPVQPIGYGAAAEVLTRMTGPEAPEGWRGGVDTTYRLTGGEGLRVELTVEQTRDLVLTGTITGVLRGAVNPERAVFIGCHHDAWLFGASDPMAGMICVMEAARAFVEQAQAGNPPDRTIVFCAWGAEEHGIIGSTEWLERFRLRVQQSAVAYVNLDMAAMGPNFSSSAWPGLSDVIIDASKDIRQARDNQATAHDLWLARAGRDAERPNVGLLGGGSDHVGWLCHMGIPSMSIGAYGSKGTSYHSLYDTLTWYRQIVGDDYEPARMVTEATLTAVARLANADVLPFGPSLTLSAAHRMIVDSGEAARNAGLDDATLASLGERVLRVRGRTEPLDAEALAALAQAASPPSAEMRQEWDSRQIAKTRAWSEIGDMQPTPDRRLDLGVPGRHFYRNLLVAPDPTSGYGSWPLPAVRQAIEARDQAALDAAAAQLDAALDRLEGAYGIAPPASEP